MRLKLADGQEVLVPWAPFTVGRSARASDLELGEPSVSGVHAVFKWSGHRWEIRDASTNGTWVDGMRVPPGATVALRAGSVLRFGPTETATVIDLGAPQPCATDGQARFVGQHGVLALLDPDSPVATVSRDDDGDWWLEGLAGRERVNDGVSVTVAGRALRLELPSLGATEPAPSGRTLGHARVEISVSRDEETVRVVVRGPWGEDDMGVRSHHYLLATLARLRTDDAALPAAERGWVDGQELTRMLAISDNLLYTYIFRCRRAFAALGFMDGEAVVARRGGGQLRLGVEDAVVVTDSRLQ